jgi:hypothetical protein
MTRPQWLSNPFAPRPAKLRPPATRLRHATSANPVRDNQTGFIHHPAGFPLEYKRIWFSGSADVDAGESHDIGLIFESEERIPAGATLEIQIPLRGDMEHFRGKVVLVRQSGDCWEIGVWFPRRIDASRMRIVEQICHIEVYLQHKKHVEGPYNLNRDRIAAEWINRNAATVPGL